MKKQRQFEQIDYPIGKETTTVGGVFKRLGLLKGGALRRALREGKISIAGREGTVRRAWERVGENQTILWAEYRIRVYRDEEAKRRRLMQESMQRLSMSQMGNPFQNKHAGGGGAGK